MANLRREPVGIPDTNRKNDGLAAAGVAPRVTDGGAVAIASKAAGVLSQLSGRIGDLADKAAFREGRETGALAGLDPEFRTRGDHTIYGEAYDLAGLETYKSRLTTGLSGEIEALADKHGDDVGGLSKSLAALYQGYSQGKGRLLDEARPEFEGLFQRASTGVIRNATRNRATRVRSEQAVALQGDVESRVAALQKNAYRLGLDDVADDALAAEAAELARRLQVTGVDGRALVDPEKAGKLLAAVGGDIVTSRLRGAFDRLADVDARDALVADLGSDDGGADRIFAGMEPEAREKIVGELRAAVETERDNVKRTTLQAVASRALDGIEMATEDDIALRLDAAYPQPGDPYFDEKAKIYDRTAKTAELVRRRRLADPAGSVMHAPAVQAARAARVAGDPASEQAYVAAVMAAQTAVGVQDPSALSVGEARQLFAMVARAGPDQIQGKMGELAAHLARTYGPLADRVMLDVLRAGSGDPRSAGIAQSVLRSVATGEAISPGDLERYGIENDAGLAERMFQDGGVSYRDSTGESWMPLGEGGEGEGEEGDGNRPPGRNAARPFSKRRPPIAAMHELAQNPSFAEDFDAEYGDGSAEAVLKAYDPTEPALTPRGAGRLLTRPRRPEEQFPGLQLLPPAPAEADDADVTGGSGSDAVGGGSYEDFIGSSISQGTRELLDAGNVTDAVRRRLEESEADGTDGDVMGAITDLTGIELTKDEFLDTLFGGKTLEQVLREKGYDGPLPAGDTLTGGEGADSLGGGAAMDLLGKKARGSPAVPVLFGGEKAAGDQTPLDRAENMEEQGASKDSIAGETGWFRDPDDNKWRFEIDDSAATLKQTSLAPLGKRWGTTVGELLSHGELLESYPDLAGVRVMLHPMGEAMLGQWDPEQGIIWMSQENYAAEGGDPEAGVTLKSADEFKSTLLHELQHAIQDIEGFYGYPGSKAEKGLSYERRPSEAEARRVERRRGMSRGERRAFPPVYDIDPPPGSSS